MKLFTKCVTLAAIAVCLGMASLTPQSSAQGVQPRTLSPKLGLKGRAQRTESAPISLIQGTSYSVGSCSQSIAVGKCTAKTAGCTWVAQTWPFDDIALDRETGCIYGQPSKVGSAEVQVNATDPTSSYQGHFKIQVNPTSAATVVIETTTLPPQPTNQPYSEHLRAFGGQKPYIWKLTQGSLPTGLSLDPGGHLYGTPTAAGAAALGVAATDTAGTASSGNVTLLIDAAPDCGNAKYADGKYFNGWFSLSKRRNVDPNGDRLISFPTNNDVVCFYGTSGEVSPLGQVQYLYGIGQGTNTISADMVSIQFPAPIGTQVSLGTSVTGGGSASTTSGQATAASALASLEAGGNFYLHVTVSDLCIQEQLYDFLSRSK
ncbi:MAG: putative Ig domain-containing protein [Terriglobales bacterium]|jgi:putative Ig domain-containing protein